MRSTPLIIAGILLTALAGCGSDAEKVPPGQPCGLLTDAEVSKATDVDERGKPQSANAGGPWECQWSRPESMPGGWELRLETSAANGSCYRPEGAAAAPDVDDTAWVVSSGDAEVGAERDGTCLRLVADADAPVGGGSTINVDEAKDLAGKALERLG